jgi:hypothetical protein
LRCRYMEMTCRKRHLRKPVIPQNITNSAKLAICRWYHHRGTITDIIKTARQVKIILNIILGKLSEPTGTLILGWVFGAGTSVSDFYRPSHKTACDIHLKHVFLPKPGLWRTPAPKSRQISSRFFGYHNLVRTVVILN